ISLSPHYSYTPSFFFLCSAAPRDLHSFPTRRSSDLVGLGERRTQVALRVGLPSGRIGRRWRREVDDVQTAARSAVRRARVRRVRSEEHTSELQSRGHLVCRLLLEKKKKQMYKYLLII